jgi:hypothetical protein
VRRGFAERLPWLALLALTAGLALHNLAMALLWQAGVRGTALDIAAAWKEGLLLVALAGALWGAGRLPFEHRADRLALLYAVVVLVYWALPQSWLGDGSATERGELYALRHHLLPVGGYVLGRLLVLSGPQWRRIGLLLAGLAAVLAAWGLVDVYAVPLDWWRDSGVPGWFEEQLGLQYRCLSGLPENWIFNTGDEANPLRRLVSTFLSPLATAYLLVVVLLYLATRRATPALLAAGALAYAGLLWTHTRAAYIALAAGLLVIAAVRRRAAPAVLAAGSLAVSAGFLALYPSVGPSTSYTPAELVCLRQTAGAEGPTGDAFSAGEASTGSHLRNLRDGIETVLRHPWGYGLGNAGVTASRTHVEIKAGESTYTELGVDAGILGALAFIAWLGALVVRLWGRSEWLAACLVAAAAIGVQTDVIGVHWIAVVGFALAGAALSRAQAE